MGTYYRVRYPVERATRSAGGHDFTTKPVFFRSLPKAVRERTGLQIREVDAATARMEGAGAEPVDGWHKGDEPDATPEIIGTAEEATAESVEGEQVGTFEEVEPGDVELPVAGEYDEMTKAELAAELERLSGEAPPSGWTKAQIREAIDAVGIEEGEEPAGAEPPADLATLDKDGLAALYEQRTGEAPDGRWGEERIREELRELEAAEG